MQGFSVIREAPPHNGGRFTLPSRPATPLFALNLASCGHLKPLQTSHSLLIDHVFLIGLFVITQVGAIDGGQSHVGIQRGRVI